MHILLTKVFPLTILASIAGQAAMAPEAGRQDFVRCVLVVPQGEKPWPDAQERLDLVLKDVQWWYSCQMEAHGFGAKTFPLELNKDGTVKIHIVPMEEPLSPDKDKARAAVVGTAVSMSPSYRRGLGPVFCVVFNGYYWIDKNKLTLWPQGLGNENGWAHFSGYHYFNICPKGWRIDTRLSDFDDPDQLFPPEHLRMLKAYYGEQRVKEMPQRMKLPVGLQCDGHGIFAHELGHAFGLSHLKPDDPPVKMDVMNIGVFGVMRGNFLEEIRDEYACLSPKEAKILNSKALFREIGGLKASTGASREVGARGAKEAIQAAAQFTGSKTGSKSQDRSKRNKQE